MGLPHYVRVGAAESDESTSTLVDLPASRGGAWLRLYGGWVLAGVVCLLWVRLDAQSDEALSLPMSSRRLWLLEDMLRRRRSVLTRSPRRDVRSCPLHTDSYDRVMQD